MATRTVTSTEQTAQMKVGASSLSEIVWSRPRLDRYMCFLRNTPFIWIYWVHEMKYSQWNNFKYIIAFTLYVKCSSILKQFNVTTVL